MAHGFLQSFDNKLDVFSAGTKPAEKVNPMAVKVMDEMSIDLAHLLLPCLMSRTKSLSDSDGDSSTNMWMWLPMPPMQYSLHLRLLMIDQM